MSEEIRYPPASAVIPGELAEPGPLPAGVDYPDELAPPRPRPEPDPVSTAAGSSLYISRPGPSWIPWAVAPTGDEPETAAPAGRLQRPPARGGHVTFWRLYPQLRLCVDRFPAKADLTEPKVMACEAERLERSVLCHENGYGYVAFFADELIDYRWFAEELKLVHDSGASPRREDGGVATLPPAAHDELTRTLGAVMYQGNVGPSVLPWAWDWRIPGAETFREALRFDRYYREPLLLVDFRSTRALMSPVERRRVDHDGEVKARLCAEQGVPYLVVWGNRLPAVADLDALIGRRPPEEPKEAADVGQQPDRPAAAEGGDADAPAPPADDDARGDPRAGARAERAAGNRGHDARPARRNRGRRKRKRAADAEARADREPGGDDGADPLRGPEEPGEHA